MTKRITKTPKFHDLKYSLPMLISKADDIIVTTGKKTPKSLLTKSLNSIANQADFLFYMQYSAYIHRNLDNKTHETERYFSMGNSLYTLARRIELFLPDEDLTIFQSAIYNEGDRATAKLNGCLSDALFYQAKLVCNSPPQNATEDYDLSLLST